MVDKNRLLTSTGKKEGREKSGLLLCAKNSFGINLMRFNAIKA